MSIIICGHDKCVFTNYDVMSITSCEHDNCLCINYDCVSFISCEHDKCVFLNYDLVRNHNLGACRVCMYKLRFCKY